MRSFLEGIGQSPIPQQIKERERSFMFYTEDDMAAFKAKEAEEKKTQIQILIYNNN